MSWHDRMSPSTCFSSFSNSPLSMYSSALFFGLISSATMQLNLLRICVSPMKIMSNSDRWYWLNRSFMILELS